MSTRNAGFGYVRASSTMVERMALELSLSAACGDSDTVQDFNDTVGQGLGDRLPPHAVLVEMINEMPPAVRLAWRSQLVGV